MTSYEKWLDEYGLEFVRQCAADGLCNNEIAQRTNISPATFKRWQKKHPELLRARDLGRREADYSVVEALYKKATGYRVNVNKTVKLKRSDFDSETGKKIRDYDELVTTTDEDYHPADMRAVLFWLKNRQPENWSDRGGDAASYVCDGYVDIPEADMIDAEAEDE